jgi:hypothetical protein
MSSAPEYSEEDKAKLRKFNMLLHTAPPDQKRKIRKQIEDIKKKYKEEESVPNKYKDLNIDNPAEFNFRRRIGDSFSNFNSLYQTILETVAGGEGSVFGPGVTSTSTHFSGDNYAPGDSRIPKMLSKNIIRRPQPELTVFGKKKKKSTKKRKRK